MNPTLPPALDDRGFRDVIRFHTGEAYRFSAERIWSPADGMGALMFSLGVYFNVTERFSRVFDGTGPIIFKRTMRQAELRGTDGMRVRWNKTRTGGGTLDDVTRPSETLIELAIENLVSQLSLGLAADKPAHWIIAHSGNPVDGLLTMHLASPVTSNDNRRIVAWSEVVPIFDARHPDLDFPEIEAPGLPEPAELPGLDLRFRDEAGARIDPEPGTREEDPGGDAEQ